MTYQTETMAGPTKIAALAFDGSQPAWMTLNAARELAFTGEIVFESDPEVHAYLDNGIVYYAERVTDATLGQRLLDAGVLDMIQLERGTVRVGDIEHLGRLFDRDPSVDRDSVTVFAENATQELITELANRAIATVRATAYRHHPSGVHRWFVAPIDPPALTRPVSVVAQLDTTVVNQLPSLPFGSGVEELTIEWDEPTVESGDLTNESGDGAEDVDGTLLVEEADENTELVVDAFEPPLGLGEFAGAPVEASSEVVDTADELVVSTIEEVSAVTVEAEAVPVGAIDESDDSEFIVVWPDGPEEHESPEDVRHSGVYQSNAAEVVTVLVHTDDGNIQFDMPPLTLGDESELDDADVPPDVAAAVRSVIAAIESVGAMTPSANGGSRGRTDVAAQLPDIVDIEPSGPIDVVPVGLAGFSPPTLATSAHALHAQPTTNSSSVGVATPATASTPGGPAPAATDDSSDRSSALRRLIGSLRRKDH